jgi:serine/threonine protein phosphatase 1
VYFDQFEPPSCDEYDEILHICSKRTANLLDLRNICQGERVIVVGDIHGYFNEFMSLLAKCEYRAGDIVVATGDLVDRGPRIRETLQWFRDTPGAYSVEGNHDNKYRRHLIGNPVKIVNGLDCTIEQCADLDKTEWAAWFQYLPQMIRIGDIGIKPTYVVHAGIDGGKSIYSQHVETCLYSRYLRGSDFYDDNNGVLWWETLDDTYNIIGGHIICEDPHPVNSAYCLDGGICDGGVLRGMVIDGDGDDVMVHEVNSNG